MKSMGFKNFISVLPIDTRVVLEYALSVCSDLDGNDLVVTNKVDNNVSKYKLNDFDKSIIALLFSFVSVNKNTLEFFKPLGVNHESILEYLEKNNTSFVLPSEFAMLNLEEKEKLYSKYFLSIENIILESGIDLSKVTPLVLVNLLKNEEHKSLLINEFFTFEQDNKKINAIKKNEDNSDVKSLEETKTTFDYGNVISGDGSLSGTLGREKEIRSIEISLKTPSKKGVILVGKPGVGKRDIVEGLAKDIKLGNVPLGLEDKKIVEIDLASIIAGTSFRGQFEEKVKSILDSAKEDGNVILYIENIHKGITNNDENNLDFVSILSSYLSRGDVSVIATTTPDVYDKIIISNDAINNKLSKISVLEPEDDVVKEILLSIVPNIEKVVGVSFPSDEEKKNFLIDSIINITSKDKRAFLASTVNPDLAKGILERVFAISSLNEHSEVEFSDVVEAIETEESLSPSEREKYIRRLKQSNENVESNNKILTFNPNKGNISNK